MSREPQTAPGTAPAPAPAPAPRGWRPFPVFMEEALYAPGTGYYSGNVRTVGRRGDFSTSATLSGDLGRAVAGWVSRELDHWGPGVRDVIEVGPGDGSLAASVRGSLPWLKRLRTRFHLVESSPPLAELQQERLGRCRAFNWHGTIGPALEAAGGHAVIYSNELVDAFPCSLFEWSASARAWREVGVGPAATWELRPAAPEPTAGLSALEPTAWPGGEPPDRQRVECHPSFRAWLASWAGQVRCASLLTVDYGDAFPALYHRRPAGTLRAYFHHVFHTGEEVLLRPGRQDITADVNFTDLTAWCRESGFDPEPIESQAAFIARYAPARRSRSAAGEFVASQTGAGGAFKALTCRRDARG